MTSEFYNKLQPFMDQIELFERSREVVTDLSGLWDITDKEYGVKIDRNCNECRTGFLGLIISEIKDYEKNNPIT